MIGALASAWRPTFSTTKVINIPLAEAVAAKFASKISFTNFQPPTSHDIFRYLRNVRNSAPGPDGIPYRAWLVAGPSAWKHLHEVASWCCSGQHMLSNFNSTLLIFTPKGDEPDDAAGVVRSPENNRPLGLKNSDVKAISGAAHSAVKFDLAAAASPRQNGFLAG
eukprot:15534606-Heterocapsa_arctica.AAC.1